MVVGEGQFNRLSGGFDVCRGPGNLAVLEILQPHRNHH